MIWLVLGLLFGLAAGFAFALPAGVWLASGIWSYAVTWSLVVQKAAAWKRMRGGD